MTNTKDEIISYSFDWDNKLISPFNSRYGSCIDCPNFSYDKPLYPFPISGTNSYYCKKADLWGQQYTVCNLHPNWNQIENYIKDREYANSIKLSCNTCPNLIKEEVHHYTNYHGEPYGEPYFKCKIHKGNYKLDQVYYCEDHPEMIKWRENK